MPQCQAAKKHQTQSSVASRCTVAYFRLMKNETHPPSPCIRTCAVSGRVGFCIGCGRKLAEIGGWTGFSAAQKQEVLDQLPARLELVRQSLAPSS